MTDPHRGECHWDGSTNWFSRLDYAVYHAPGWEEWQAFRQGLVGQPIEVRVERMNERFSQGGTDILEVIRLLNLTRSHRAFHALSLDALRGELNRRYITLVEAGE